MRTALAVTHAVPMATLLLAGGLLTGCITAHVVRRANDPHPSFRYPGKVTAAGLTSDALYIAFDAVETPEAKRGTVVVRIVAPDLKTRSSFIPAADDQAMVGLNKLPVHVEKSEAIPAHATPVGVRTIRAATLRDLEDAVASASGAPEVWVVNAAPGAELEAWGKASEGQPISGPMLALVLPSEDGLPQVGLFKNYDEVPHGRRAMWLVTPFSAVADAVLLPGYLVYMLCGGN